MCTKTNDFDLGSLSVSTQELNYMYVVNRRGFKERRTGRTPPPLKFPKIIGYSGIYIYVYIRTDISVNSIYLPLNSDFISIIQTLLGSSDL